MEQAESAKTLYQKLETDRKIYLDRARDASKITIPYLFPPEGFSSSSRLNTPWQSVGARGVNNLSAKLLLALLPPNTPFFRLVIDEMKAKEEEDVTDELLAELEKSLQKIEQVTMKEVAKGKFRTSMSTALKHLIVGGNVCLSAPKKGELRMYHLDRYVVKRDPSGNVLLVITQEEIAKEAVPESIANHVLPDGTSTKAEALQLYTCQRRLNHKTVIIWQEIDGVPVPDSAYEAPIDEAPLIPLRFTLIDGEDYGRGLIEDYLGDLESLEALTKAIREGASASAKVMFFVKPNGATSQKVLAESPNGAIVSGDVDDVGTLQVQKHADFRVAMEEKRAIEERLNSVFLTATGMVRNAERVTAEEIRMLQQELEVQHGGLYTLLASEGQLPLAKRLLKRLEDAKSLPKLPTDIIDPVIITGVEALGRGNDLAMLDNFANGIQQMFGPEGLKMYLNPTEYLSRRASALSINVEGLVRSADEVQAQQEQEAQQAMMQKAMPQVVQQGGKMLANGE